MKVAKADIEQALAPKAGSCVEGIEQKSIYLCLEREIRGFWQTFKVLHVQH